MGKPVAGQHLPQLAESLRIALKVRKWHTAILNINETAVSGGFQTFSDNFMSCNLLIINIIFDLLEFSYFFYAKAYISGGSSDSTTTEAGSSVDC
jgi:hypothetical protein